MVKCCSAVVEDLQHVASQLPETLFSGDPTPLTLVGGHLHARGVGEMTQWVRALVTNPNNLSLSL